MANGNEAFWALVRQECLLEELRAPGAAEQMEQAPAPRVERPARPGRLLQARLGHLLAALGRRLEDAAAWSPKGV